MPKDATYWVCKCGDRALNTPDGEGLRTMRLHKMERARAGERGHHIMGLFTEDGVCLVAGDNPDEALARGYLKQKPESKLDKRKKQREKRQAIAAQLEAGGPVVKSPANLMGIMTAMRIAFDPSVWGWLALGFRYLRKEDGSPYTWTPEDVSEYIGKVIQFFHMEHLHEFFGLTREEAQRPEIKRQLQAIVDAIKDMGQGPALPVDLVKEAV